MSNEITIGVTVQVNSANFITSFLPGSIQVDLASQVASGGAQIIGTATNAEFIVMGDVTAAGYSWFRNLDATNYVDIGTGTGTSFVASLRLKPGQIAVAPLHPTNPPSARANVGACNLFYNILSA